MRRPIKFLRCMLSQNHEYVIVTGNFFPRGLPPLPIGGGFHYERCTKCNDYKVVADPDYHKRLRRRSREAIMNAIRGDRL